MERRYPHPKPRFVTLRLLVLLVPMAGAAIAAWLRSASAWMTFAAQDGLEAYAAATGLEGASLALLLSMAWDKRTDRGAVLGLAFLSAVSVALSMRLAYMANAQDNFVLAVIYLASIGINVTNILMEREVSRYIAAHERAVQEWDTRRLQWTNRRLALDEPRQRKTPPRLPASRDERVQVLVNLIQTEPRPTMAELVQATGRSRAWVYAQLKAANGQVSNLYAATKRQAQD